MSVLIKGMEMPENCFECPCCRHDSVDGIKAKQCNLTLDVFDANYFERWNSRAQNCPLVEVKTPHERLIDADKLMMSLADWWYSSFGQEETDEAKAIRAVMQQVEKSIDEMTVIEAEGSE